MKRLSSALIESYCKGILLVLLLPSFALSQTDLKIGVIASLTGPAGEEGKNWVDGAVLAAEELTKTGTPVTLVIEDDQTQPIKVVSAFGKMVRIDKVSGILGGTWDFLGEAAYPLANQYKLPFITPSNPPEILSPSAQENPYVFTSGLSLEAESKVIAEFLKAEKIKSITLLVPNIPWGTFHASMMRRLADSLGIKVIDQHEFAYEGYPDVLRSIALRISKNPAELIFAPIDYNGIDLFTREFKKLKIGPKLLTTQHLDHAFELSSEKHRFSECYAVYPKVRSESFESAFNQRFGRAPGVYSAHGYDSLNFLAQALLKKVDLGRSISPFSHSGITGTLSFPPKFGRALNLGEAQIMTTASGQFEEYHFGK